ncbi:unnamed protein product [Somion occarium]
MDSSTGDEDTRSRRVGIAGPPPNFQLPAANSDGGFVLSSSQAPLSSPPLPPRSPLRPTTRRFTDSSSASASSSVSTPGDTESDMTLLHSRSLNTFSNLLDIHSRSRRLSTPDKPLPTTPSSMSINDSDSVLATLRSEASSLLDTPAPMSKRTHALLELLSSERAFASDLALIRNVHIPLALGQPGPFPDTPVTPPPSSSGSSSSRAVSTASDASSSSSLPPPMTQDDVRIIFNNVAELAEFSGAFSERLEEALGNVLEGGNGDDHVGALFLEMIPEIEPIYTLYITKHPSALEHLSSLPQTASFMAYLSYTRDYAQSLSHAWDLQSLLIKPVQRLLKYALLLSAIIDETPDSHPDKPNLKEARSKMETVAHGVNEGRRRREVVKEVLTGTASMKKPGEPKPKKKGLNMGVSAAASLARMKTIRSASAKAKEGVDGHAEAAAVAEMNQQLKLYDSAIRDYAKGSVRWAESVNILMENLRTWSISFGQVLGIKVVPEAPGEGSSEAFNEFMSVIDKMLIPASQALSQIIEKKLLVQLAKLRETTAAPERLLEAMYTLEPLHYGLLNINVSKTRPSPQLLEASKSYVALRGQLYAELPRYLQLLQKGIHATVMQLTEWQARFWGEVLDGWVGLWDALKIEGEARSDAEETKRVWEFRFLDNQKDFEGLNILQLPRQTKKEKDSEYAQKSRSRSKSHSFETASAMSSNAALSMLASLEPMHASPKSPNAMMARSTHSIESGRHGLSRRDSNESLRSKKSGKSGKYSSHQHTPSSTSLRSYQQEDKSSIFSSVLSGRSPTKPAYSRTKSMPISLPMQLRRANSQGRLLDADFGDGPGASSSSLLYAEPIEETDDRGRSSRKPGLRRRLTDSLRPSPAPSSRHRRSPSLPATTSSPSYNQLTFNLSSQTLPTLYTCRVVHACEPPPGVSYYDLPFFTLRPGDLYDVLQECGHPSTHKDLPLFVDDGEDCVLLVRNKMGMLGWVLASFLLPAD